MVGEEGSNSQPKGSEMENSQDQSKKGPSLRDLIVQYRIEEPQTSREGKQLSQTSGVEGEAKIHTSGSGSSRRKKATCPGLAGQLVTQKGRLFA